VFVNFVVEPDGSVSNVTVLRGIGGGCDEEAMRVVKNMPKWKPGKQRGKAVRVQYMLPVNFRLQ
jgi:protein TonB